MTIRQLQILHPRPGSKFSSARIALRERVKESQRHITLVKVESFKVLFLQTTVLRRMWREGRHTEASVYSYTNKITCFKS